MTDIGPLVEAAAREYGVPLVGLLACLKAESGLNPYAERNDVWPDVSFGLGQQIVEFAPVGDGSDSPSNVALVKAWLFDRQNAIETAARHLAGDYATAQAAGDSSLLGGLIVYNCGHYPAKDDPYWSDFDGNVANYQAALGWARGERGT